MASEENKAVPDIAATAVLGKSASMPEGTPIVKGDTFIILETFGYCELFQRLPTFNCN